MMQEQSVATGPSLERSIGLGRVVFQSVTTMAPGASVVFGLGLIMVYTGIAAPFAMLIGAIGAVIVAFCIGQLATRIPSAGGFYSYAAITFGNAFGFIVGWLYSALYVILVCVSGINFALVTQDFLSYYFHFAPPYWLLVAIIVLVILGVTYIGVRVSTGLAAILGIIEVGIILLLTIILIARAGDANSLALFNPAHAAQPGSSTLRSVFLGIVFAFAATAGFEACLPLAEEAKNPKRTVPLALMLSAGLIGAFYVLATYAAIVGWGRPTSAATSTPPTPGGSWAARSARSSRSWSAWPSSTARSAASSPATTRSAACSTRWAGPRRCRRRWPESTRSAVPRTSPSSHPACSRWL